jgi:F0F1-type ATP synthase membrane subunit b/b'
VPADGTVDEALGQIELGGGWPALLKAWAKGDLSHQELLTRAKTPIEQIEAQFYVTMATARDNEQLEQELRKIATSTAIQLVEVTIARDLTAPKLSELKLPSGVTLP